MPGNELEVLNHYKKKIENNLDKEDVLLRALTKLDKVLVNIALLQDTGIGRTVSILKKHDNEVGSRSRDLVLKWKAIVAREESEEEKDDGGTEEEEVDQNGSSDNNNSPSKAGYVPTPIPPAYVPTPLSELKSEYQASQDESSEHHDSDAPRHRPSYTEEREESGNHHKKLKKHKREKTGDDERHRDRHREKDKHSRDKSRKIKAGEHDEEASDHGGKMNGHAKIKEEDSDGKKDKYDSKRYKDSRENKHERQGSSSKHRQNEKVASQKLDKHSSEKENKIKVGDEGVSSKYKEKKREVDELAKDEKEKKHGSSRTKEKSRHSEKDNKHEKRKGDEKNHSSERNEERSRHKESKAVQKIRHEENGIGEKEKSSEKHKKEESRHGERKHKESSRHDEKTRHEEKKARHEEKSRQKEKSRHEKSNGHDSKSKSDVRKVKQEPAEVDIFAAMNGGGKSSGGDKHDKARMKRKREAEEDDVNSGMEEERYKPKVKQERRLSTSSCSSAPASPPSMTQLTIPSPPSSAISSTLISGPSLIPDISPNYKPLPRMFVPTNGHRNDPQDENMLDFLIGTKGKRQTAIYSGAKRSGFKGAVPSLKDQCIGVLQNHVDEIDECGGLGFDILQPILERASPGVLMHIEDKNPYLMEDTGQIWEKFCKKDFRNDRRNIDDFESWREMYERCFREKEEKLSALKEKMASTYNARGEVKDGAGRQTKITYVDTVPKPPRNVARQQAKHGTALPVGHSLKVGATRPRLNGGGDPTAGMRAGPSKKPKVAPMMAKVKRFAKGIYRR